MRPATSEPALPSALERAEHETIRISRSLGVDLITGVGLTEALDGVDAVVDAISSPPISPAETVTYFGPVGKPWAGVSPLGVNAGPHPSFR